MLLRNLNTASRVVRQSLSRHTRQLSIKARPDTQPSFVPRHLAGANTTVSSVIVPYYEQELTRSSYHARSSASSAL